LLPRAQGPVHPEHAAPTAGSGELQDESAHLWFVELRGRPLAAGGRSAEVARNRTLFRDAARDSGIEYQERMVFERLWNGLSVSATTAAAGKLAQLSGVEAVYPVEVVHIPELDQDGGGTDMATALAMTGADFAQLDLGLSGQGIRVAVMDTGIDYHHPDLGGCFGPGCRVVAVGISSAMTSTPIPPVRPTTRYPCPGPIRTTAMVTAPMWPASSVPVAA
jgi:minor extracellular serine protease Vpr